MKPPNNPITLRIFVSSPSDVVEERNTAFEIIEKIARDPNLRDRVILKGVGWDRPDSRIPMSAWETPQQSIKRGLASPSACDIVAVIFWMRFGTPMPADFEKKPDGSPYLSGTEYEYLDAMRAARNAQAAPGRPQVLVYRRPPVAIDDSDPAAPEKREQKRRLRAFFEQFKGTNSSLHGGINDYADAKDFREKFEHDIRYLVRVFLDAEDSAHHADESDDATNLALAAKPAPIGSVQRVAIPPSLKGTIWGRYRLLNKLGAGGMAQVWEAEQLEQLAGADARIVAFKLLLMAYDQNHRQRFITEMNILKRFTHSHIVPVYDYGEVNDQLFLTMPLMKNGSMADWLSNHPGAIPQKRAFDWLDQIASALDYAHEKQIKAHRDVKPANILLYEFDEDVALADFGIARSNAVTEISEAGVIIGSRPYMAPEQFEEEEVSIQTDIYALGIVAYELLTGHRPYLGEPAELRRQHLYSKLPDDAALTPEILEVLHIATARQPKDRYPTARDFAYDLRNAAAGIRPETLDGLTEAYLEQMLLDLTQEARDQIKKNIREMYVGQAGTITHLSASPEARPIGRYDTYARIEAKKREREALLSKGRVVLDAKHCAPNMPETQAEPVLDVRAKLQSIGHGVLLGEPGTGKTFTFKQLFVDYADVWLEATPEQRATLPIPVFVPLREYSGQNVNGQPLSFADFVAAQFGVLRRHAARLLKDRQVVLLCDALNEMPRGENDQNVAAVRDYLKDKSRYLISCRVRDYRGEDLAALKPLEQVYLQELDLPRIKELIAKRLPELGTALWQKMGGTHLLESFWQRVVEANRIPDFWNAATTWDWHFGKLEEQRDWGNIHTGAHLIPLCRNPFMAFLLCSLYEGRQGELPASRAALFGDFAETLLFREEDNAESIGRRWPDDGFERIQGALVAIASAMQSANRTVLSRKMVNDAIADAQKKWIIDSAIAASILIQEGDGETASIRFAHQLLQEYFACHVLNQAMGNEESATQFLHDHGGEGWWDAGVWRETTVILGEFLGEEAKGPNRVARWLAPASPEVALNVILQSGAGLPLTEVEPETRDVLIAGAQDKAADPDPRGRASAYRVLGLFDVDRRPGVGLRAENGLPDLEWCAIPSGEFIYLKAPFQIDYPYWISAFPVTYRQFERFLLDDNGYKNPIWWDGMPAEALRQQHEGAANPSYGYWNNPRDNVSWYEATAFCRWLTDLLHQGQLPLPDAVTTPTPQFEIGLPTEPEWAKAARGPNGRLYPGGDEFTVAQGNYEDTGIGRTSAVGIFPEGRSYYGAWDMGGNVWEWCLETTDDLGRVNPRIRQRPPVRGGSWHCPGHYRALNTNKARIPQQFRDRAPWIGFRVALREKQG